jgi:hypothetical protein
VAVACVSRGVARPRRPRPKKTAGKNTRALEPALMNRVSWSANSDSLGLAAKPSRGARIPKAFAPLHARARASLGRFRSSLRAGPRSPFSALRSRRAALKKLNLKNDFGGSLEPGQPQSGYGHRCAVASPSRAALVSPPRCHAPYAPLRAVALSGGAQALRSVRAKRRRKRVCGTCGCAAAHHSTPRALPACRPRSLHARTARRASEQRQLPPRLLWRYTHNDGERC